MGKLSNEFFVVYLSNFNAIGLESMYVVTIHIYICTEFTLVKAYRGIIFSNYVVRRV